MARAGPRRKGSTEAQDFAEAPSADVIIEQSAELEKLIRREAVQSGASSEIGDHGVRAEELMLTAAKAGFVTWESARRGELRRIILLWGTALRRNGRHVSIPDLEPFGEQLPELDDAVGRQAVELAQAGEPIVGLKLEGADLRALSDVADVKMFDCALYDCDLRGVTLERPRLIHTTFADCRFDGATLTRAVVTSCVFGGGNMSVRATNATFNGSRFDGVTLTGASFRECSFGSAGILRLDASGADFFDALFDLAAIEKVGFDRAILGRAIFVGATVRRCVFKAADLEGAIFSSTSVQRCDFGGAKLKSASFEKARDVGSAIFDPGAAEVARFAEHDAAKLRSSASPG